MERFKNWWKQACGPAEILAIALPLIASTISFTIMQFCDRLFMAWYSNEALAAALPAGVVSWTLASLPLGVASYGSTFVAQYHGANRHARIGAIIWQAIWLGIVCIPVFLLLGFLGRPIFSLFGHAEHLVNLEADYFLALSLGSGALILDTGIAAFFIGRGKTMVVMLVNVASAVINVILDYGFIFGWGWIPEMGIWGAGLATAISIWLKVIVFASLFLSSKHKSLGTRKSFRLDWPLMKQFLSFGVPNGIQFLWKGWRSLFLLSLSLVSAKPHPLPLRLCSASTCWSFIP